MTHKALKFSIAGVIFAGALGYLAYAGMSKAWVTTLSVDTYLADPKHRTEWARLRGLVSEKELDIQKVEMKARFILTGEKAEMPVAFRGTISDMFKAGSEVLIEGKMGPDGVFVAETMMTKCASKYDEKPKNHPGGSGEKQP